MNLFFRAGYFREDRDNGKHSTFDGTEEVNDTRWKTASGGVRIVLPDQSDLQARLFTDYETFFSNFLAVPAADGGSAQRRADDAESERADHRRRRHGAVVEGAGGRSTSSPPAPTGAGSKATARRMCSTRPAARR